jgi:hypothetical protein
MPDWNQSDNLIIVAGHAIFLGRPRFDLLDDENWVLEPFQAGEPRFYLEHIRAGVDAATADPSAILVFSGGQSRERAGPRTEAQSYWMVAEQLNWWGNSVRNRTTTEEYARDSFENLLFSVCRFYECTGRFPRRVKVITWAFKAERFELHRKALRFPANSFVFDGVNNPEDLAAAQESEQKHARVPFTKDPYGTAEAEGGPPLLGDKRRARNPFQRSAPYGLSCPALADLLAHRGPELFQGTLPWDDLVNERRLGES